MNINNYPVMNKIELHITYLCNSTCPNCSNQCSQAPSSESMSLDDVKKFIDDSIQLNYKWEQIVLHGGEPTLHKDFEEMCRMLNAYKSSHNQSVNLYVCSNGYSELTKRKLEVARQNGIILAVSVKDPNGLQNGHVIPYIPVNEAPIDISPDNHLIGCFQTSNCGICLNNKGFFECSPAGSMSRMTDWKSACTELKDLTQEKLISLLHEHCKYCGFALDGRRRVTSQTNTDFWEKKIVEYKLNRNINV